MNETFNFDEAINLMIQGEAIESVVSRTTYEINDDGWLVAEGIRVDSYNYILVPEREGQWQRALTVSPDWLTDEMADEFLESLYIHKEFNEKYRGVK